jgi:hypothetical protein
MSAGTVTLWVLLIASIGVFARRSARLIAPMRTAAPAQRFDRVGLRMSGVLRGVGLHERLL